MTATRIHVIAAITAIVIAATAKTTTLLPAAAQQSTIHIIKHGSN
jgi:hypothetical protein